MLDYGEPVPLDLEDARGRALQQLFSHDLRRLSDDEVHTEREHCLRELGFATLPELGDTMIPAACWQAIYAERVAWLDEEVARRWRVATFYKSADTGFTPEYVEDVKRRIHLAEYIASHYPGTKLKRYGGGAGWLGRCPFHDDTHPSLGVWEQPAWHWFCFVCLTGGDVFNLLLKDGATGFKQAVLQAADDAGIARPKPVTKQSLGPI